MLGGGPLAAFAASFLLGSAGEAVREVGVGALVWGAEAALSAGVAAALAAALTRRAASRRRRDAGEPGRRWARRERCVAPVAGGRPSLGTVTGRGRRVWLGVGVLVGLEGLGHLEDGSGQTGLRGWEAGPLGDGRAFSLEAGFGAEEDGVRALRWSCAPEPAAGPGGFPSLPPTGVEGREEEPLLEVGRGSWVGFLGEEGAIWRAFFAAMVTVAPGHFLGRVGVQAGEGA